MEPEAPDFRKGDRVTWTADEDDDGLHRESGTVLDVCSGFDYGPAVEPDRYGRGESYDAWCYLVWPDTPGSTSVLFLARELELEMETE